MSILHCLFIMNCMEVSRSLLLSIFEEEFSLTVSINSCFIFYIIEGRYSRDPRRMTNFLSGPRTSKASPLFYYFCLIAWHLSVEAVVPRESSSSVCPLVRFWRQTISIIYYLFIARSASNAMPISRVRWFLRILHRIWEILLDAIVTDVSVSHHVNIR